VAGGGTLLSSAVAVGQSDRSLLGLTEVGVEVLGSGVGNWFLPGDDGFFNFVGNFFGGQFQDFLFWEGLQNFFNDLFLDGWGKFGRGWDFDGGVSVSSSVDLNLSGATWSLDQARGLQWGADDLGALLVACLKDGLNLEKMQTRK
jgi:hypothetical protein